MFNVFISMPMAGLSREDIRNWIKLYKDQIEHRLGCKVKIVNKICSNRQVKKYGSAWCLGKSIQQLSKADVVYFANGWKNARGCKIEYEVAKQYYKSISYLHGN